MTHVQLLLQSLLRAFRRDEPYVSKFLFHFAVNRGAQAICSRGNFPGEIVNVYVGLSVSLEKKGNTWKDGF